MVLNAFLTMDPILLAINNFPSPLFPTFTSHDVILTAVVIRPHVTPPQPSVSPPSPQHSMGMPSENGLYCVPGEGPVQGAASTSTKITNQIHVWAYTYVIMLSKNKKVDCL